MLPAYLRSAIAPLDGGRLDRDKRYLRLELRIVCLVVSLRDIHPKLCDGLPGSDRFGRGC
jgi:hypothetical protein